MQAFLESKDKAAWFSGDSTVLGVQGMYNKYHLLCSCLERKTGDVAFSDSLVLNEVCKEKLFAQCLAHDGISVNWIHTYTEKYLLPAGLDNCCADSRPQSRKPVLLIRKPDFWLPFQMLL